MGGWCTISSSSIFIGYLYVVTFLPTPQVYLFKFNPLLKVKLDNDNGNVSVKRGKYRNKFRLTETTTFSIFKSNAIINAQITYFQLFMCQGGMHATILKLLA